MNDQERRKRTTLILPEVDWRQLKIEAIRQGRDLQDLVTEALRDYLKKIRKGGRDAR